MGVVVVVGNWKQGFSSGRGQGSSRRGARRQSEVGVGAQDPLRREFPVNYTGDGERS